MVLNLAGGSGSGAGAGTGSVGAGGASATGVINNGKYHYVNVVLK